MLVYEEYLTVGVSIYISHITIFTFATVDIRLTGAEEMPALKNNILFWQGCLK